MPGGSPRLVGVLVAVGTAPFEADLLAAAARPGTLHVVRRCVDVADLLATAASRQASVAIVSAQLRGLDSFVVTRLEREGVSALGMTADAESADEAMLRQLGVTSVGYAAQIPSLAELVAEVTSQRQETTAAAQWADGAAAGPGIDASRRPAGRLIAVWGPTGAPGRTALATGVAAEAAALGRRTLLIDADVYGGSVAARLGLLDEASGLLSAARAANQGTLRPEVLVRQARAVSPLLRVVTGLPRADRWVEVGSVPMRRILDASVRMSDVTVVDCGFSLEADEELSYDTAAPRRNGATLEVLARADVVVTVGGADPVSLGRLVRGVHELRSVVPGVSTYLVVNRVRSGLGWPEQEIVAMVTRATGQDVAATLPDDPSTCDRALVHGKTLTEYAPDCRLTRGLRAIASDLVGAPAPAGGKRRRAGRAR